MSKLNYTVFTLPLSKKKNPYNDYAKKSLGLCH